MRGRFDAERGVSNAKAVRMLKVSYMLFWRNLMCSFLRGGGANRRETSGKRILGGSFIYCI